MDEDKKRNKLIKNKATNHNYLVWEMKLKLGAHI